MKFTVNSEKYGKIVYSESAWTGRKSLTIADRPLNQLTKDTYVHNTTIGDLPVKVKGTYMTGVTIDIAGDKIEIIEKPKWYVLTLIILFAVIPMVWSNVPSLVKIFPIVGGLIGGLVIAVSAIASYMLARKVDKPIYKILVMFAVFLVSVAILYLLGILLISALAK